MLSLLATLLVCLPTITAKKIQVGIVGLPNVGKSSLFNALAQKSIAQAANFPFCTIEPNVAPIAIPDKYLAQIGALAGSSRTVPATINWIDVAGLAKGASRGEGLGNRFLGTARECDCILHVVRAFEDPETVHVDGRVDPAADIEVIHLELVLADLAHAERRLEKTTCKGEERTALEAVVAALSDGLPARSAELTLAETRAIKSMGLLTLKPMLYAFNVDEADLLYDHAEARSRAAAVLKTVGWHGPQQEEQEEEDGVALVSARLEAEVAARSPEEQRQYLASLDVEPSVPGQSLTELMSYNTLPPRILELLNLALAYTGPGVPAERSRTTRAHLFSPGLTAAGLAGRIHGDIQRGFVRAEVAAAPILLEHASYAAAKDAGCVRIEGRDALLHDGDVVLVKWTP